MTTVFQLITIISFLVLTVAFYFSGNIRGSLDTQPGEIMWIMRGRRIGSVRWRLRSFLVKGSTERIQLTEGTFLIGNRLRDDIFIDDTGKRILLLVNVQKQKVLVNVLKGSVYIMGESLEADEDVEGRLEARSSGMKIELNDVELEFLRSR